MGVRLKISFDGSVPGIADHKLDLASFASALSALADGLRRTASGLVSEALEPQKKGPVARRGDIHVYLDDIQKGSLELNMSVEPPDLGPGYNLDLFEELPVRAVKHFFGAIEEESKGALRNSLVRKFLRALPDGLSGQRYQAFDGEASIFDIAIGAVTLPNEPNALPAVIRTTARIAGVTFNPTLEVRVDVDGMRLSCAATDSMIDAAMRLHTEEVTIVAVMSGSKGRLIWLGRTDEFPAAMTQEQRGAHVLSRWEGTLERLSR